TTAIPGGPAFTLTVNGTGFINGVSVVRWTGSDRTTTFVSGTQLTASITQTDIILQGTAQVTVFNPPPGGGSSNGVTFTIAALTITTTRLPDTTGGKSYDFRLAATAGAPPLTWSLTGTLPADLTLNTTTGQISGTAAAGVGATPPSFTVQVTDSGAPQQTDTQALSILVRATGPGRNDTCTAASTAGTTAISNGTIRAALSPYGDVDVYSFQGTASAQITIETFAERLIPTSFADTVIELLDANCTQLAFNDDNITEGTLDSLISFTLSSSGTFFIRVRDFRGDGRPDLIYELRLSGAN
ncbi:MAG: PPC domain-containing protein, partial [Chloroflexota bacterium]